MRTPDHGTSVRELTDAELLEVTAATGGKPNPGSKSNAHHHDAVTSLEVAVGHEVHTPPGFRRPLNCRTPADWRLRAISYPVITVTSSRAVRVYGHRNNGKEPVP